MIDIAFDEGALAKAEELLGDCRVQIRRAANAAINRAIITVKKEASQAIREVYIVKAKDVKGSIALIKAKKDNLEGMIISKGTPLMLNSFRMRARKKKPYRVQVKQEGSLKPIKGLFVQKQLPLQRVGAARYPLRIPHGPSVPQMFGSEETLKLLVPVAEETLNKRFLHAIEYRYGRKYL